MHRHTHIKINLAYVIYLLIPILFLLVFVRSETFRDFYTTIDDPGKAADINSNTKFSQNNLIQNNSPTTVIYDYSKESKANATYSSNKQVYILNRFGDLIKTGIMLFLGVLILLVIIFRTATNSVVINKGYLIIKSLLARKLFNTTNRNKIPLDSITNITIFTSSPNLVSRTHISQLKYSDKVVLKYFCNGEYGELIVNMMYFPGFKKILSQIMQENPEVKITYKVSAN